MKLSELLLSYNQIDTPKRFEETEVVIPLSRYLNMLDFVESKKEESKKKESQKTSETSTLDNITWVIPSSQKSTKLTSPYFNKNKWVSDMTLAYKKLGLSNNAIKNLIAKNALESNWGKSALGDYNFGNITTGSSWSGRYVQGNDHDANGKKISLKFRAYDSMDDYVKDEILFLTKLYDFNQGDDFDTFIDKLLGNNSGKRRYAEDKLYSSKVKQVYNNI